MAKNSVRDFDATAANNTDIQSVDIAENCAPSGINNAIRELMADIKDVSAGTVALESPQADSLTVTGDLTVDTDTLFVDASEDKVVMGTTSADADASVLTIKGTDPAQIYDGQILIHGSATTGAADTGAGIGFKGHHGTGNRNLGAIQSLKENGTSGNADAYMRFVTRSNSGGLAEAMRIDSSGNLLVAQTSGSSADVGHILTPTGAAFHIRDGGIPLILDRLTSDGEIARFRKDGTTVGSIQSSGGTNLHVQGTAAVVFTTGSTNRAYVASTGILPWLDNNYDLGSLSGRWDDVYATNGTIQTSDQNEKQQIASLTDAEITAAKAISGLFKTFKWNDKVETKGDAARTHAGVIAQDVQSAMTDAGLDAADYAFFCSDTWWETQTEVPAVEAVEAQDAVLDDDGNIVTEAVEAVEAQDAYTRTDTYDTAEEAPEGATERTRLGIRYPELLAFVGAATEQRLTSIEARLTALEA